MKNTITLFIVVFSFPLLIVAQQDKVDLVVMEQIRKEGLENSKVMDIAFQLTDVNGPRLTNSPGYDRATDYVKAQLEQWGLTNVYLDSFGEFGKGWELERSYVAMKAPYYKSLTALPKAWTRGTSGLKMAEVVLVAAKEISALRNYKGKLANKILILDSEQSFVHTFKPNAKRFSDKELQQMEVVKPFSNGINASANKVPSSQQATQRPRPATVKSLLKEMAEQEGALAILNFNLNAKDGIVIVGGSGGYKRNEHESMPDIMLSVEDYMTIIRLLKADVPVKIEMDIQTKFTASDLQGYNVLGDIVGTSVNIKDEIVMLGAHLDSWHGSTGATDNAAGVAVIMEAFRILKALNLKPNRTIRIALWGGEEQGLLGSKGYVRRTFTNAESNTFLPAYHKFAVYYNLDNGSGKIRGVYLHGNEAARQRFSKWLAPFSNLGAKTLSHSNTGGLSDQYSFLSIGLPAFQFIQDPLDYDTRTHHTNANSYDHLIADDLKKSAVIVASVIFNAAMHQKLPRN